MYNDDRTCNFSSLANHPQEHASIVWVTNSICLPTIALVGIACNVLNIVILTSHRGARRMPSWNLLVALAVCDTFFLFFAVTETSPLGVPAVAYWPLLNRLYAHSALYVRSAASTFYKSSILIVLAFNTERFVYVVYPLRAHRICTERTSRMAILGSIVISLTCSLQWPICYRISVCNDPRSGRPMHSIVMSDSEVLQTYYRIMDWLSLLFFNLLPIAALLILNSKLIMTLKRVADEDSKRKEGGIVRDDQPSSRTTANAMLFAVVIILLICLGSQAPARLLFTIHGQYAPYAILYASISQQLVFLNASLNFALYYVVSKRYRDLMRATLIRLCTTSKHPHGSAYSPPRTRSSRLHIASSAHYDHFPLLAAHPRGSIQSNPEDVSVPRSSPPPSVSGERRESAPLLGVPNLSSGGLR